MTTLATPPSKKEVNRAGALYAQFYERYYEVGDACFEEFELDDLLEADDQVTWWREQHARPLAMVNANLRYYTKELQNRAFVTQRLKRKRTIVDKLVREPKMKLTQMEDIGGCRVLVRNQAQARALADRLLGNWHIKRFRDYVIKPKPSGYRALHLVEVRRDRPIEIQIRTPLQDRWANQVERDSRRLGVGFKSGAGVQVVHDYYVAVADLFALQESGGTADKEFLRRIAERFRAAEPYLEVGRP